jgi:hypothetical protein
MVKKEFGTLKVESIKAIVAYFSSSTRGRASEIGVSGSLMSSLRARGYAKVVDVVPAFVRIDGRSTYKKVYVNVYALTVAPSALYDLYCSSVERIALTKKSQAEKLVESAKYKLNEVEVLLKSI